jgi:N-acetylmuramoyl-L-alanine amidase
MSTMLDLPAAYRAQGLTVFEVPGWRTRGHQGDVPIHPIGGLWHDTGDNHGLRSVFNYTGDPHNPTGPDERPDVPQPRANIWIPRSVGGPDLVVVAAGRAYHAGQGSARALDDIAHGRISHTTGDAVTRNLPNDTLDGNSTLIGHEVECRGGLQVPTPHQVEVMTRVAAAECATFGWTAGHHAHHRQYTNRKVDMSWHGDFWTMINDVLEGPEMATVDQTRAVVREELEYALVALSSGDPNSVATDPRFVELRRVVDELSRKLDDILTRLPAAA